MHARFAAPIALLFLVSLVSAGSSAHATDPKHSAPERQIATVVRVVDGDTVTVQLVGGGEADVRLIGVNAPELSPVQCGAYNSKRLMKRLLPERTRVVLRSDPSQNLRDPYGRLLRYVASSESRDVSRSLIKRGRGQVVVVDGPFRRLDAYRAAQDSAKHQEEGNWLPCPDGISLSDLESHMKKVAFNSHPRIWDCWEAGVQPKFYAFDGSEWVRWAVGEVSEDLEKCKEGFNKVIYGFHANLPGTPQEGQSYNLVKVRERCQKCITYNWTLPVSRSEKPVPRSSRDETGPALRRALVGD